MPVSDKIAKRNRKGRRATSAKPVKTSGGKPIKSALRKKLEDSFGQDLSAVKVHVDKKAQDACAAIGAEAFTQGEHIFFASPDHAKKLEPLAHEVSHVLQQREKKRLGGKKVMVRR